MSVIFGTDKKAITAITANDGAATRKISAVWGNVDGQKAKLWEQHNELMIGTLPIGAKVKFGTLYNTKLVQTIANQSSSLTTLITDSIVFAGAFDAMEPANSDNNRKYSGNNRYLYSNIRQWLNSTAAAGKWYTAQHSADMPPASSYVFGGSSRAYDTLAGYLNQWSADDINKLQTINIVCEKALVDGGGTEIISAKVYLPSSKELGAYGCDSEGPILQLFSSNNTSRIAYYTAECIANGYGSTGYAGYYWTRTRGSSRSSEAYEITDTGSCRGDAAVYGTAGIRPLCNISASTLISPQTDSDGCYTLI